MESGWFNYGYGGTLGLNTKEDESHLFHDSLFIFKGILCTCRILLSHLQEMEI